MAPCTHGVPREAGWSMTAWVDCLRKVGGPAELVGLWAATLADAHGHVSGGNLREVALAHREDIGLSGSVIREAVYQLHNQGLFWAAKRYGYVILRPRDIEAPVPVAIPTPVPVPTSPSLSADPLVWRYNPNTAEFEQGVPVLDYLQARAA